MIIADVPLKSNRKGRIAKPRHANAHARASAVLSALMPEAPMGRLAGNHAQEMQALLALAVTPDRVQQLTGLVLGAAELSMRHVASNLQNTPMGGEPPKGTRDWTVVGAILVDKFIVLQQLLANLDGKSGTATVAELNEKAHRLLAITQELERRGRARDVTPDVSRETSDDEVDRLT